MLNTEMEHGNREEQGRLLPDQNSCMYSIEGSKNMYACFFAVIYAGIHLKNKFSSD